MTPSKETRRAEGRDQPGRNPREDGRGRIQSRITLPPNLARVNAAVADYEQNLEANLQDRCARVHTGRYRPQPVQPNDGQSESSPRARAEDERYSYEAEQWAARNCVVQRANDTAAGVVIGGILGAIIGSGVAGRYDRGAGAVVGGALGATAGGVIGSAAGANNPNCPPGYVLAPGAAPFYPGAVYGDVIYAAPAWYDPWIWYGGHWIYRPYPYHRYWYRTRPRGP